MRVLRFGIIPSALALALAGCAMEVGHPDEIGSQGQPVVDVELQEQRFAGTAIECNGPVNDECPTGTVCCPTSHTCIPESAVGDCEASTIYEVETPRLRIPEDLPDPTALEYRR